MRAPLQFWGCHPMLKLELEPQQQGVSPDPTSPRSLAESCPKAEHLGQDMGLSLPAHSG